MKDAKGLELHQEIGKDPVHLQLLIKIQDYLIKL